MQELVNLLREELQEPKQIMKGLRMPKKEPKPYKITPAVALKMLRPIQREWSRSRPGYREKHDELTRAAAAAEKELFRSPVAKVYNAAKKKVDAHYRREWKLTRKRLTEARLLETDIRVNGMTYDNLVRLSKLLGTKRPPRAAKKLYDARPATKEPA